jgi:hypothetical protein
VCVFPADGRVGAWCACVFILLIGCVGAWCACVFILLIGRVGAWCACVFILLIGCVGAWCACITWPTERPCVRVVSRPRIVGGKRRWLRAHVVAVEAAIEDSAVSATDYTVLVTVRGQPPALPTIQGCNASLSPPPLPPPQGLPEDVTADAVKAHFEGLYNLRQPDWTYEGDDTPCGCCRRKGPEQRRRQYVDAGAPPDHPTLPLNTPQDAATATPVVVVPGGAPVSPRFASVVVAPASEAKPLTAASPAHGTDAEGAAPPAPADLVLHTACHPKDAPLAAGAPAPVTVRNQRPLTDEDVYPVHRECAWHALVCDTAAVRTPPSRPMCVCHAHPPPPAARRVVGPGGGLVGG